MKFPITCRLFGFFGETIEDWVKQSNKAVSNKVVYERIPNFRGQVAIAAIRNPVLPFTFLMLACSLGVIDLMVTNVRADEIRSERVIFSKGETATTIKGKIKGYEIVDYKVRARATQSMVVNLETDNLSNYFNILAPGEAEVAFFVGSVAGNRFEGGLPKSGDYTIRVYLMRNAARRDATANYRLEVAITTAGDVTIGTEH